MSIQQLNDVYLKAGLKDKDGDLGTSGFLLSSTGTQTDWIDPNGVSVGSSENIQILVKNISSNNGGISLSKGDPVYIYGSVGASPRLYIDLADADSTATNNNGDGKMPCAGLLAQDLAPNAEGVAIVVGKLKNLITSPIDGATPTENDTIYVKSGGGLTLTKPTGVTNLIQNVGQVGRVSTSSDGNIVVSAILRSNDVPNLPTGRIWVGDGNTTTSGVVYLNETTNQLGINTTTTDGTVSIESPVGAGFGLFTKTAGINNWSGLYQDGSSNWTSVLRNSSGTQTVQLNSSGNSYLNGGNVGIGTTSPSDRLEVAAANSQLRLTDTDDSKFTQFSYSSGKLVVRNNSTTTTTNQFTLDLDGKMGIGTTSPQAKTHVFNSIVEDGLIVENSSTSFVDSAIFANNTSTTNGNLLRLRSSGSDKMVVLGNGDVGIGTSNPGERLSIQPGADVSAEIGEAHIGLVGFSGYAGFSHVDRNSAGNYALLQASNGATYLNTSAGQPIRFRINNVDKMILSSGGKVGIGTTSPGEKLTVKGTDQYIAVEQTVYPWGGANTLGLKMGTNGVSGLLDWRRWTGSGTDHGTAVIAQVNSDGGYGLDFRVNNQSTNTPATTSRMFLSSSGEVGIGTTTPDTKLHIVDDDCYITLEDSNSVFPTYYQSGIIFKENRSRIQYREDPGFSGLILSTGTSSYSDRVYIRNNGYVGIGTNGASSARLEVEGTSSSTISRLSRIKLSTYTGTTYFRMVDFVKYDNVTRGYIALNEYSVQYNTSSDYRLKENITYIDNALEKLKKLKPSRFNWKGGPSDYLVDGFIAHELAEVVPEAVSGEKDAIDENNEPLYQGVDQSKVVPLLTAALQKAIEKIEQLETRIQTLENN